MRTRNDIRTYAKSAPAEAWAEAYANFYCSPESNAFIQKNLPFTHEFLRAVLAPPIWETSQSENSSGTEVISDNKGEQSGIKTDGQNQNVDQNSFSIYIDQVITLLQKQTTTNAVGSHAAELETDFHVSEAKENNNAITLALTDLSESSKKTGLMVSTPKEITHIEFCIGESKACAEDNRASNRRKKFRLTNYRQGHSRNFFSLQTINSDQEPVSYIHLTLPTILLV